ncbi:unnamed protein product, partial [Ectocarpus sp. 12 AP-2014]
MIAAGEPRSKICGTRSNSAGGVAATSAAAARSTSQCSDCGDEGGSCGDGRALSSSSADAAGDPGPLVAVAQQCSRLIFEMFNITDELLFYALKHEGLVGEFALKLANLVYSVVFRHEVFVAFAALALDGGDDGDGAPVFLRRWGAHVNHFLGYFPCPQAKPSILPLVDMRRSLAPFFAALPAGDKGRTREGVPTVDD